MLGWMLLEIKTFKQSGGVSSDDMYRLTRFGK
jgi:hypothetical protein